MNSVEVFVFKNSFYTEFDNIFGPKNIDLKILRNINCRKRKKEREKETKKQKLKKKNMCAIEVRIF